MTVIFRSKSKIMKPGKIWMILFYMMRVPPPLPPPARNLHKVQV